MSKVLEGALCSTFSLPSSLLHNSAGTPATMPSFPNNPPLLSAECKRGRRKGATSKKTSKSSKSVKKFFDIFRQFSRRAKNVKNRQKVSKSFSTLFDNFRAAPVFRPLLGGSDPRQIQEYCLAGVSWGTVGPLASALQEAPKPYSSPKNARYGFSPPSFGCTPKGPYGNTAF